MSTALDKILIIDNATIYSHSFSLIQPVSSVALEETHTTSLKTSDLRGEAIIVGKLATMPSLLSNPLLNFRQYRSEHFPVGTFDPFDPVKLNSYSLASRK